MVSYQDRRLVAYTSERRPDALAPTSQVRLRTLTETKGENSTLGGTPPVPAPIGASSSWVSILSPTADNQSIGCECANVLYRTPLEPNSCRRCVLQCGLQPLLKDG